MKSPKIITINLIGISLFTVFMMFMPWNDLAGGFVDRLNYDNYFNNETSILEYKELDGIASHLANEFIWHLAIGRLVSEAGLSTDVVFLGISGFYLFLIAYFTVQKSSPIVLLMLVSPLLVELAFSQLRLTAAFLLVITAYLINRRYLLIPAFVLAAFVHTAMVLFGVMFVAAYFISRLNSGILAKRVSKILILGFVGLMVSLLISPLRAEILMLLGDRRVDYHDMSSSVAYSLFWICLLIVFSVQSRTWFNDLFNCYSFVILSLVFFNVFFSGLSLRFLAASLPMITYSTLQIENKYKSPVIMTYFIYLFVQWVYWLRLL